MTTHLENRSGLVLGLEGRRMPKEGRSHRIPRGHRRRIHKVHQLNRKA